LPKALAIANLDVQKEVFMTLHEYLKSLDKAALGVFAIRCGTSVGQLKQVAYGNRRAGAALAVGIERESAGSVTCEQLRADIDWAYLRGSKAA
jgi:DNA-binding transcriptional regulator YdaS (Cro superfamily)